MLHDAVVPMRIDPDIRILREAPVHDGAEHTVHMGITGYSVYHMVGAVIQPGTALYIAVGGFGRGDEGEIADRTGTGFHHISVSFPNVVQNHFFGRIPVLPLPGIAGCAHNPLGRVQYVQDSLQVLFMCRSDEHVVKLPLFVKRETKNFGLRE